MTSSMTSILAVDCGQSVVINENLTSRELASQVGGSLTRQGACISKTRHMTQCQQRATSTALVECTNMV